MCIVSVNVLAPIRDKPVSLSGLVVPYDDLELDQH